MGKETRIKNVKKTTKQTNKKTPYDRGTWETMKYVILELDTLYLHLSSTTDQFCELESVNICKPRVLPLYNGFHDSICLSIVIKIKFIQVSTEFSPLLRERTQ